MTICLAKLLAAKANFFICKKALKSKGLFDTAVNMEHRSMVFNTETVWRNV